MSRHKNATANYNELKNFTNKIFIDKIVSNVFYKEKIKVGGKKAMYKKLYEQPDMYIDSGNNCNIIVMSGTGWDDDFDNPTEGGIIL